MFYNNTHTHTHTIQVKSFDSFTKTSGSPIIPVLEKLSYKK